MLAAANLASNHVAREHAFSAARRVDGTTGSAEHRQHRRRRNCGRHEGSRTQIGARHPLQQTAEAMIFATASRHRNSTRSLRLQLSRPASLSCRSYCDLPFRRLSNVLTSLSVHSDVATCAAIIHVIELCRHLSLGHFQGVQRQHTSILVEKLKTFCEPSSPTPFASFSSDACNSGMGPMNTRGTAL
jgi:hypothetical protein